VADDAGETCSRVLVAIYGRGQRAPLSLYSRCLEVAKASPPLACLAHVCLARHGTATCYGIDAAFVSAPTSHQPLPHHYSSARFHQPRRDLRCFDRIAFTIIDLSVTTRCHCLETFTNLAPVLHTKITGLATRCTFRCRPIAFWQFASL